MLYDAGLICRIKLYRKIKRNFMQHNENVLFSKIKNSSIQIFFFDGRNNGLDDKYS